MKTLFLATHNPNKIRELSHMLHTAQLNIQVLGPDALGHTEQVEETGNTFLANAQIKAHALFNELKQHPHHLQNAIGVLADDSGICVNALNSEPGVHSAYYAGPNATYPENNQKLLTALKGLPKEKRTAHFACTLVFIDTTGKEHTFTGKLHGHLAEESKGNNGFGYDPLMIPQGYTKTCAELSAEEKNKISHRGIALQQLIQWLKQNSQEA
jgi:XTP/dITP diphosphohydrolase